MEIWLRVDRFARAAGLKWSGSLGYIAVGVGGWLAGFRRNPKGRMVGEWKGQGPGVERRGLVGTDPRNHQAAMKVKSLHVPTPPG